MGRKTDWRLVRKNWVLLAFGLSIFVLIGLAALGGKLNREGHPLVSFSEQAHAAPAIGSKLIIKDVIGPNKPVAHGKTATFVLPLRNTSSEGIKPLITVASFRDGRKIPGLPVVVKSKTNVRLYGRALGIGLAGRVTVPSRGSKTVRITIIVTGFQEECLRVVTTSPHGADTSRDCVQIK